MRAAGQNSNPENVPYSASAKTFGGYPPEEAPWGAHGYYGAGGYAQGYSPAAVAWGRPGSVPAAAPAPPLASAATAHDAPHALPYGSAGGVSKMLGSPDSRPAASALTPEAAAVYDVSPVAEPRPTNPGSRGHPHDCKPCNKFDPNKEDSCKHGNKCEFCHCQHDRPRHRGQRGRHAQQKRLFFEQKEMQQPEIVELTNKIYDLRHLFEEVRRAILALSHDQRDTKFHEFMQDLRDIGEEAHQKRPDHERVRGNRPAPPGDEVTSTEVDKRCKWLLGTLHLMLRKKDVARAPIQEIQEAVYASVDRCKALRDKYVAQKAEPGYCTDGEAVHVNFRWLENSIRLLASQMQERGASRSAVQDKVGQVQNACEMLHTLSGKVEEDQKVILTNSESLSELLHTLKQMVEKEQLLTAESFEDLERLQRG